MKRKRFSVEQTGAILEQVEVGVPVVEVCRQVEITEQTFYRWSARPRRRDFVWALSGCIVPTLFDPGSHWLWWGKLR